MEPVLKVLVIALVVLVAVHVMKHYAAAETYVGWINQEFERVPAQPFAVPKLPLVINAALTAPPQPTVVQQQLQASLPVAMLTPVLTQVGTDLPAVAPTMVPTFVPTVVPTSAVPTPSATPTLITAQP